VEPNVLNRIVLPENWKDIFTTAAARNEKRSAASRDPRAKRPRRARTVANSATDSEESDE
jgi:hypothetical protein